MRGDARADEASKEYLIKAAFIYNFIKFVEWPGQLAVSRQSNINICVLGDNPFASAGGIFRNASTPQLKLSLVEERALKDAPAHCHILFISRSEAGKLSEIMAALRSSPILTISDIENFSAHGGMVSFVLVDSKVKLVISPKAASAAGLRIDAQLLEIAYKVLR